MQAQMWGKLAATTCRELERSYLELSYLERPYLERSNLEQNALILTKSSYLQSNKPYRSSRCSVVRLTRDSCYVPVKVVQGRAPWMARPRSPAWNMLHVRLHSVGLELQPFLFGLQRNLPEQIRAECTK
jgi:hypothetical protein